MNVQNISSIRSVALGLAKIHRILTDEALRSKLLSTNLTSMPSKVWHTTPGET